MKQAKVDNFSLKFTDFICLDGNDVITKKISDHHPIVHDGVFFWNIMMQCKQRGGGPGFNNGFGFIESEQQYLARLLTIAQVIAEAVSRTPSIKVISLCEGPIKAKHVEVLFHALMKFPFMARFMRKNMFYKPTEPGQNWGLLMLADTRFTVNKVCHKAIEGHSKLANRFQLWRLENVGREKYVALAHFPFAGDEYKTEKMTFSASGIVYCELIDALLKHYSNDRFIFCADFNFNPYLISKWQDRIFDKISHNNSILLTADDASRALKTVTVDGVLLSAAEKQKYHFRSAKPGLFAALRSEYCFFQNHVKQILRKLGQIHSDNALALASSQPS